MGSIIDICPKKKKVKNIKYEVNIDNNINNEEHDKRVNDSCINADQNNLFSNSVIDNNKSDDIFCINNASKYRNYFKSNSNIDTNKNDKLCLAENNNVANIYNSQDYDLDVNNRLRFAINEKNNFILEQKNNTICQNIEYNENPLLINNNTIKECSNSQNENSEIMNENKN